jgi:prepilin-type N-terminal cleavage/methylation domain-containing protein
MNARTNASHPGQRGFSLVELMVAMTVTLIVSSAIYGLLTTGGNAFRREPEMADRQQNIRIAMDAISRDVENAGGGAPLVAQVFTHTDSPLSGPSATGAGAPYLNGAGPLGVMGVAGRALRGAPPTGAAADPSDNTDILEIVIGEQACPEYRVCTNAATPPSLNGTVETIVTREAIPVSDCLLAPGTVGSRGLVLITNNVLFTMQPATLNAGGTGCFATTAGSNGSMTLAAALPEWSATIPLNPQPFLYKGKVVRYMIAPGLDPTDTSPSLWRSESGRYTTAGASAAAPVAGATNWQIIARGIDDLQVEYLNGGTSGVNGLWANNPGVIAPCPGGTCALTNYNSVIRRVRVTLSALALAPLLQGQTAPAGGAGPNAVRGQLVSVVTPRAAVLGLQSVSSVSGWQ